jgi:hypothetical protein
MKRSGIDENDADVRDASDMEKPQTLPTHTHRVLGGIDHQ